MGLVFGVPGWNRTINLPLGGESYIHLTTETGLGLGIKKGLELGWVGLGLIRGVAGLNFVLKKTQWGSFDFVQGYLNILLLRFASIFAALIKCFCFK